MGTNTNWLNLEDFAGLPGADLVASGLSELEEGCLGACALLVLAAAPRLIHLGIAVPARDDIKRPIEHRLYELLETTLGEGAYSRYNSLMRRIVSFESALEHIQNNSDED